MIIFFLQFQAHKSAETMLWLEVEGWNLLIHAAYSPDLAPADFWAFPTLKKRLAGIKYDSDEEMMTAVRTEFARMCQGGLGHVFDKWEKRMRKVIECGGDYIEK